MIDLKSDPFEYSWDAAANWEQWAAEHTFLLLPAVAKVSTYLSTYKEFPPRQRPASFSIDQVSDKLNQSTKGK
jgi:arylsulfatase